MMDQLSSSDLTLLAWITLSLFGLFRYYQGNGEPSLNHGAPMSPTQKAERRSVFWMLAANLVVPIFLKLFLVLLENSDEGALDGWIAGVTCFVGVLTAVYIRRRGRPREFTARGQGKR